MTRNLLAALAIITTALAINAWAQESAAPDAPPPAPAPAQPDADAQTPEAQTLPIVVTSVEGQVQVREGEDQPWKKAEVGMEVTQGAEFRTGLRSAVQLRIPPDQIITLDRLGTLTVLQAIKQQESNQVKTDLGMKYGRTRYQIEAADQLHDSTIRTASATLAVRGSDILVDDTALGFIAQLESEKGVVTRFKELQLASSMGQRGKVEVTDTRWQAADLARHTGSVSPTGQFASLTFTEQQLQDLEASVGGFALRGIVELHRQLTELGGTGIGVPEVDGPLIFTASWFSSDFESDSDIDLEVDIPGLGNLTAVGGSLGSIPQQYVHSGNATGVSNSESVVAALSFVSGSHTINVINNGSAEAQVFITVERGPLADLILNQSATLAPSQSQTFNVSP